MSPAEKEQLIAMSPAGRISHYLKKKIAGTISTQKYEECIAYALSLPYTTAIEESREMGTDIRESGDTLVEFADGEAVCDVGRCGETSPTAQKEPCTPPVQRPGSNPLPVRTDGIGVGLPLGSGKAETDKTGSQKERLLRMLQDGEWHTTPDIQRVVYGGSHLGVARIGARADDLRKDGHTIESKKVTKSIWAYRLVKKDGFAETIKNIASG